MGDDAALLQIISFANIACGGHAGERDVMSATSGRPRINRCRHWRDPFSLDLAAFGRIACRLPRGHTRKSRSAIRSPASVRAWPLPWHMRPSPEMHGAAFGQLRQRMKCWPETFTRPQAQRRGLILSSGYWPPQRKQARLQFAGLRLGGRNLCRTEPIRRATLVRPL